MVGRTLVVHGVRLLPSVVEFTSDDTAQRTILVLNLRCLKAASLQAVIQDLG